MLFRSLEIACQAARLPTANRVATIHDVGLSIAEWVSPRGSHIQKNLRRQPMDGVYTARQGGMAGPRA